MSEATLSLRPRLLRMARRAVEIVLVVASIMIGLCGVLIGLGIGIAWVQRFDDPDQIEANLIPTQLRVRQVDDRTRFWMGCESVTFAIEAGVIDPASPDPVTNGLLRLPGWPKPYALEADSGWTVRPTAPPYMLKLPDPYECLTASQQASIGKPSGAPRFRVAWSTRHTVLWAYLPTRDCLIVVVRWGPAGRS